MLDPIIFAAEFALDNVTEHLAPEYVESPEKKEKFSKTLALIAALVGEHEDDFIGAGFDLDDETKDIKIELILPGYWDKA